MSDKKKLTIYEIAVCAIMTALICIFAPMSVPIGIIPISLTGLVLYFTIYLLGMRGSLISYVVYLLIGTLGLPVFSNYSGGVAKLLGPTGGYLVGYIFMILIAGAVFDLTHTSKIEKKIRGLNDSTGTQIFLLNLFQIGLTAIAMVIGTAVAYAFGTAWFVYQQQCTVSYAISVCVIPFIPFDLAKMVIGTILGRSVRYALIRAHLLPKIR